MIRLRQTETRGEHVHVDVFIGPDADHLALCGRLVVRESEADELQRAVDAVSRLSGAMQMLARLEYLENGDCPACNETIVPELAPRSPTGHHTGCRLARLIPGATYRGEK